ncbi:MAG TPA: hypothetical protein VLR94_10435 [Acidobacteriota bacterium]|nr:hypothetical protein [Acidobacteriota bacterium]
MKVLEMLRKAGAKAGLLQIEEETKTIEIKIVEKKIVSLKKLEEEVEQEDLSSAPPEVTVGFDRVFEAMNLQPPAHGWTVERIHQMLDSNEMKSKSRKEVAEAILVALGQNQVKPEDVVKDAASRDKALDSYEQFVEKKMQDRAVSRKRTIEELHREIKESEEQIRKLEASQSRDDAAFQEWQTRKVAKEEELARVASLFLENHGITVGNNKKK